MENEAIFEKIEAWLSGELAEAEARVFEAEIAADPVLAAEVERHRRGREALDRLAEQAIQADMALWRESLEKLPEPPDDAPPNKGTTSWLRWIPGILLVALMGGMAYWYWTSRPVPAINVPVQEKAPVPTKPDVPVAVTPPDEPENVTEKPNQKENSSSRQLVAVAETNLNDFQGALQLQYGPVMGDDGEENAFFKAGVEAFKQNKLKAAKRDLLKVPNTDPFYPSAREILAFIYFREKNYPRALQCYEAFAGQSADPETDWRLVQFYLADYPNNKADLRKKLDEISGPDNHHRFQQEAENLKKELEQMGVR